MSEEKLSKLLLDEQLELLKTHLGKKHFTDCLFMLYLKCGEWGKAKGFAYEIGVPLSFNSYRARMTELKRLGLAQSKPIDSNKKSYFLTERGVVLAEEMLKLFENVESALSQACKQP